MAVVIRMMRAGAKKRPFYRVVAADSRRQRDGRFLEILGHYDPIAKPYAIQIDADKVKAWLAKGAQPSDQAASLFRLQGIDFAKAPKAAKKDGGPAKKGAARAKPREKTERRATAKAARVKKRAKIAAKAAAPKEKKKKKS